jgi:hypothetical protein
MVWTRVSRESLFAAGVDTCEGKSLLLVWTRVKESLFAAGVDTCEGTCVCCWCGHV